MNRDEIIQMAREVGIDPESDTLCNYDGWVDTLVDFAVLVAAAECEAILDLVDAYAKNNTDLTAAIRARGQK